MNQDNQTAGGWPPWPWKLTSDAGHPSNARVTSSRRRHIAKVYAASADADPVGEANAHLIAAAPRLAEALTEAVWCLENIAVTDREEAAVTAARAALSQARGETK